MPEGVAPRLFRIAISFLRSITSMTRALEIFMEATSTIKSIMKRSIICVEEKFSYWEEFISFHLYTLVKAGEAFSTFPAILSSSIEKASFVSMPKIVWLERSGRIEKPVLRGIKTQRASSSWYPLETTAETLNFVTFGTILFEFKIRVVMSLNSSPACTPRVSAIFFPITAFFPSCSWMSETEFISETLSTTSKNEENEGFFAKMSFSTALMAAPVRTSVPAARPTAWISG